MTRSGNVGDATNSISLLDSLDGKWLKLPLAVMRDAGPATQTLAGILKVTNRETFAATKKLALVARLPVATMRKHLATLDARGWIENAGRERTRRGAPRRTCTIKVTKQTIDALGEYGVLPWWACCSISKVGRLPWSAKAVLSIIMARLMALKKAATEHDSDCLDDDELWGAMDNLGGDDRYRFSLDALQAKTGLSRESVVDAKRRLATHKIITWCSADDRTDGGTPSQLLSPSPAFRVRITPAGEGRCYVAFGAE